MDVRPVALLGAALAALAAVAWAGQYVCIRLGTERGRVSDAMVVVLLTNVALVVPAAAVLHYPDYGLSPAAAAAFATGGVAGSLLSRVLQFRSTQAIGASRTAPVVSSSALVAALLAVALLGETLTPQHLLGVVLIVGGVAVISWETASDAARSPPLDEVGGADGNEGDEADGDEDDEEDGAKRVAAGARAADGERAPHRASPDGWRALALPLLAALFLGVEPLFLKLGLATGTPPLVGLAVMATTATAGFLGYARWRTGLPDLESLGADLKWHVGAGVGSTVALLAYFAALSLAPVVVVVPILQAAPLVVMVVSLVALPRRLERVTPRLAAAAAVVVAGAVLVSLYG